MQAFSCRSDLRYKEFGLSCVTIGEDEMDGLALGVNSRTTERGPQAVIDLGRRRHRERSQDA